MNWISFAERRPEEEPNRLYVIKTARGTVVTCTGFNIGVYDDITWWLELGLPPDEPPKPDPREEVWQRTNGDEVDFIYKMWWFSGWDAAIKHSEAEIQKLKHLLEVAIAAQDRREF